MPVFLGLDCGGSSCRALAVDGDGNVLHQGQAGPANIISTPEKRLRTNLCKALAGCPDPDYVAGCFAGLITEQDRERARGILSAIFPAARIRLEADSYAALKASRPGTHICVVAGTGSLVCSEADGVYAKSGGRGFILGDAGSAFRYGQDALLHFLDHGPERSSEVLKKTILHRFQSLDESEIIARLYRGGSPQAQLAKLGPALAADARAGHQYALESIMKWTGVLAAQVEAHARQHFPHVRKLSISLAGGLWEGGAVFKAALGDALAKRLPDREIEMALVEQPPVRGAVRLAAEMAPTPTRS